MKKLNKIKSSINQFLSKNISEIFVVFGLISLIYATYRINLTASIYVAGEISILLGLFFAYAERR